MSAGAQSLDGLQMYWDDNSLNSSNMTYAVLGSIGRVSWFQNQCNGFLLKKVDKLIHLPNGFLTAVTCLFGFSGKALLTLPSLFLEGISLSKCHVPLGILLS